MCKFNMDKKLIPYFISGKLVPIYGYHRINSWLRWLSNRPDRVAQFTTKHRVDVQKVVGSILSAVRLLLAIQVWIYWCSFCISFLCWRFHNRYVYTQRYDLTDCMTYIFTYKDIIFQAKGYVAMLTLSRYRLLKTGCNDDVSNPQSAVNNARHWLPETMLL